MRDTIALRRLGTPAVAVSWDNFAAAARAYARMMKMEDAPIVVVPAPRGGRAETFADETAPRCYEEIVGALVASE